LPTRIYILQRIIQTVAIAVKALRIGGIGYYRIRADEPAYLRVVVSGIIVVQPGGVKGVARENVKTDQLLPNPEESYNSSTFSTFFWWEK
jgi:hypothetical protein